MSAVENATGIPSEMRKFKFGTPPDLRCKLTACSRTQVHVQIVCLGLFSLSPLIKDMEIRLIVDRKFGRNLKNMK